MVQKQFVRDCEGVGAFVVNITEKGKPEAFVVTVNFGLEPWAVDSTGQEDVTDLIKQGLAYAEACGGGIVYLPAGIYLVSDCLEIPTCVTLRGAYADPDKQSLSEGTVLKLSKEGGFKWKNAVRLSYSAAVQGIAFWYEEQSLTDPIAYDFTIAAEGASCITVRDCTFVNSYNGFSSGKTPIGMVTLDGLKGTALHCGIEMEQHADISIITDTKLSPVYWARAGETFGAPAEVEIRATMKRIDSIGMYLGDCDRDTYENLTLDGFATGIYNREMTRVGASGSYIGLKILDATIGIDAYGVDTRYGWLIACSEIRASEIAIRNKTPQGGSLCCVNLVAVELNGKTVGSVKTVEDSSLSQVCSTSQSRTPIAPPAQLFALDDYGVDKTGKTDASAALQKALNDATNAGGGIVYLPAGVYLLENPINGGANTRIQGAHPNTMGGTADLLGTVLLVKHGQGGGEDDTAAITLTGENSGVTGVCVIYPENGVRNNMTGKSIQAYAPFLRCEGKNTYLTNSCLIATSRVVHFKNSDNFIADRLTGTFYDCGVRATDSDSGLISRIHTNGTYHTIAFKDKDIFGRDWFSDGAQVVVGIIDPYLATRLTQVKLENCRCQKVTHTFYYGGKYFIEATKSIVTIVNGEGARSTTESFVLKGKTQTVVINFNRPNGATYIKKTGSGNRIQLHNMDRATLEVFNGLG